MSVLDLSIIIVNYNGAQFLSECLDSIFASQTRYRYEVIVVDNASTDDSLKCLAQYSDKIILKASQINGGFSYGNNRGAELSSGRYIFMLNNDTKIPSNLIEELCDYYDAHPEIGALAPKLLNADGSVQGQGSLLGHSRYNAQIARPISFVSGAAVMTTRELWTSLGGLDENFFFYNEDIDFCKRILKLGKSIIYYPKVALIHYGGLSTSFRRKASIIEGYRGGLYLVYKHYPRLIYWLYRVVLLLDVVPRLGISVIRSLFDKRYRDNVAAYLSILKINFTGNIIGKGL